MAAALADRMISLGERVVLHQLDSQLEGEGQINVKLNPNFNRDFVSIRSTLLRAVTWTRLLSDNGPGYISRAFRTT